MIVPWKFLLIVVVAACLVLAVWFFIRDGHSPKSGSEALTWAIELQQAGRYDEAVQVLQTWLKGPRRDASQDGFLYQQIAMIYIAKAYKKPATKDESVHRAELSLQQALAFFGKKEPEDIDIDLYGIGLTYETLGDLSEKDKCQFYGKAKRMLVRQLPLIKGDSYTAYGKTVPLEPLRAEIRKHLDGVNQKSSSAG